MFSPENHVTADPFPKSTKQDSVDVSSVSSKNLNWWQDVFLIGLILSLFFSVFIGVRPLSVPDEARYSEIPREMVTSSDYITPRLNTIKYFEKPALFYWLQAGTIRAFGLSEWAMRLPTLLLAVLGCIVTYVTARGLFDRRSGWYASFALATSILYFAMAHTITLDMAVSVFLTACLSAFILAVDLPEGRKRNGLLWTAYVFAGFAVLTKGLIGLLLPAAVIGIWILVSWQWKLLLKINLFSGVLLFLGVTIPWHVLVQNSNPEFFHFYFIDQHFLRYFTLYAKRYQPDWFFIPVLLLGFFPWVIFLFQAFKQYCLAIWQNRFAERKPLFLLLWAGIVFLVFSLSKSKLIPYILPMFPPLAMLIGHYLSEQIEKNSKTLCRAFASVFYVSLFISVAFFVAPYFDEVNDLMFSVLFLYAMAFCLITGTFFAMRYAKHGSTKSALTMLLATMSVFLVMTNMAVAAVDTRSIKPLAELLKLRLKPDDEVISYHHYYQDLPFYLQKRVTVVDFRGELEFGMLHQKTDEFMIDDKDFWKRFDANKRVYAVMTKDTYYKLESSHPNMNLLGETKDNVLVANAAYE